MTTKPVLAFALLLLAIEATSSAAHADGTISACGPVTVPGTYTVTKDITAPPNTDCITIMASGVAIDLKGHTISGSGSSSGITDSRGPMIDGPTNIIIANGTIKGFNVNLDFTRSSRVTISSVKAVNGVFGIHVEGGYAVVTDSEATNNEREGIELRGSNNTILVTKANINGTGVTFGFSFLLTTTRSSTAEQTGMSFRGWSS